MNEIQYRVLCEACDHALIAPDPEIERVAVSWLHIIREHPVFLENYKDLYRPVTKARTQWREWWRVLRIRAGWLRQIVRALRSGGESWHGSKDLPQQIDVLFVSHLLDVSHAGRSLDFYYGNLPNELVLHGYVAAVALINHTNQPVSTLVRRWNERDVLRLVLSRTIGFAGECAIHGRLKKESARLRVRAKAEMPGLRQRVLARAAQEAQSSTSQETLRIGMQIRELVGRLKPRVIVVTHEGHAWERVVFSAARGAHPKVRCIGYQHATIFRLQHAIRRSLTHNYNPDQIMTAGAVSKQQLERSSGIERIPISVLGSSRSLSKDETAIDTTTVGYVKTRQTADTHACLVLPEGLAGECHILFEFSLACAYACPEIQFVWRLHPAMSFESLVGMYPKLRNLPLNIELSRMTLEEDFARSRWALYRGTTAVLQAVVAGLRPVYLQLRGEMPIDPLYEIDGWRAMVETIAGFQEIIRADTGVCDWPPETEISGARAYCQSYFLPYDVRALITLIPK